MPFDWPCHDRLRTARTESTLSPAPGTGRLAVRQAMFWTKVANTPEGGISRPLRRPPVTLRRYRGNDFFVGGGALILAAVSLRPLAGRWHDRLREHLRRGATPT